MLEYLEKAIVVSCSACRAVCMVGSDHGTSSEDGGLTTRPVKGRTYIVVRDGRSDDRFWREVDGPRDGAIRLPTGQIVSITERPFFCADCYETGGDKLDASWKRSVIGICTECKEPFRAREDGASHTCHACQTMLRFVAPRVPWC